MLRIRLVCLLQIARFVWSTCNVEIGLIDVQLCCNRNSVKISITVKEMTEVTTDPSVLYCYNDLKQIWHHEFGIQTINYSTNESFSISNATYCSWQLSYEDVHSFPPSFYYPNINCTVCKLGYSDTNSCQNIDECLETSDICNDTHAQCRDTDGSFECICKEGFDEDGQYCRDIDECSEEMDDCGANAACRNTEGSYECICRTGFRGNGTDCEDIDECVEDSHECHDVRAECINNNGSYTCTCKNGFTGDGIFCEYIQVSTIPGILAVAIRKFSVSSVIGIVFGTSIILGLLWCIVLYMSRIRKSKNKFRIEDSYKDIKKFDEDFIPVKISCQTSLSVSHQSIETIIHPMEGAGIPHFEQEFNGFSGDIQYNFGNSKNRIFSGARLQQGYLNIGDGQFDVSKLTNSFISHCES